MEWKHSRSVSLARPPLFIHSDRTTVHAVTRFLTLACHPLGSCFTNVLTTLYPTVGLDANLTLRVNFGDEPFMFNAAQLAEPSEAASISGLTHPSGLVTMSSADGHIGRAGRARFGRSRSGSDDADGEGTG